jgi:hypothetical protein
MGYENLPVGYQLARRSTGILLDKRAILSGESLLCKEQEAFGSLCIMKSFFYSNRSHVSIFYTTFKVVPAAVNKNLRGW